MEKVSNPFFRYPEPPKVLQYPGVPGVLGGLIEVVHPVPHLAFPGEISPPLLELSWTVHGGDLLVVADNNSRISPRQCNGLT